MRPHPPHPPGSATDPAIATTVRNHGFEPLKDRRERDDMIEVINWKRTDWLRTVLQTSTELLRLQRAQDEANKRRSRLNRRKLLSSQRVVITVYCGQRLGCLPTPTTATTRAIRKTEADELPVHQPTSTSTYEYKYNYKHEFDITVNDDTVVGDGNLGRIPAWWIVSLELDKSDRLSSPSLYCKQVQRTKLWHADCRTN